MNVVNRSIFRTLSNIYNENFYKKAYLLKAVNYFHKNTYQILCKYLLMTVRCKCQYTNISNEKRLCLVFQITNQIFFFVSSFVFTGSCFTFLAFFFKQLMWYIFLFVVGYLIRCTVQIKNKTCNILYHLSKSSTFKL